MAKNQLSYNEKKEINTTLESSNEQANTLSNNKNDLKLLIGSRVVRGPHWKWDKQDGYFCWINDFFNLNKQFL